MVKKYPKGTHKKAQPDFEISEFDCPCRFPDCTFTLLDDDLVLGLQMLRDNLRADDPNCSLLVSSGFRCTKYQAQLRAKGYEVSLGTSQHELGKAADVFTRCHSGDKLSEVAQKIGFTRIGVFARAIHVDVKDLMEPRRSLKIWYYPSYESDKKKT